MQYTDQAFIGVLADNGIATSLKGKDACRNNVSIERLGRSVKYEKVYCGITTASVKRDS